MKVWANANELTSEECTNSLRKLRGASKVSCERLEHNSTTATGEYLITFHKYPMTPYENNLFQHDGNPDISLFKCNSTELDVEDAVDPYCVVVDVDTIEEIPGKISSKVSPFMLSVPIMVHVIERMALVNVTKDLKGQHAMIFWILMYVFVSTILT